MPREPGFYWVRSAVYGRWSPGGVAARLKVASVAELYGSRWWFASDSRTPLESDPDIEVVSERLTEGVDYAA